MLEVVSILATTPEQRPYLRKPIELPWPDRLGGPSPDGRRPWQEMNRRRAAGDDDMPAADASRDQWSGEVSAMLGRMPGVPSFVTGG